MTVLTRNGVAYKTLDSSNIVKIKPEDMYLARGKQKE